jgi:[methyl-Co(III) methanol-specific corrinoid protein]:coenzyme M methyltransferase
MITPRERLLLAASHSPTDRFPMIQPLQTGTIDLMRSSGAFWPEAHRDSRAMAKLSFEAHSVLGLENFRIPFDMNIEPEAMGCTLDWRRWDNQPWVRKPAVEHLGDLENLEFPDLKGDGRFPVVISAVEELREITGAMDIPIIVGIEGPFTMAAQIFGVEKFILGLYRERGAVENLLDLCESICTAYSQELSDREVDAIAIIDGTSSSDLISPDDFERYSLPHLRRAIEGTDVPKILHVCGRIIPIREGLVSAGADVLSVDSGEDITALKTLANGRCSIAGNIDVVHVLLRGDTQRIIQETRRCISESDIPCPGCGFPPATRTESILTMVREMRAAFN